MGAESAASAADEEIFSPEFLELLRRLLAQQQHRRVARRRGARPQTAHGHSREFKDRRPYVPGDDLRDLDWYLYARLDRLFIRLFESVRTWHCQILIDVSASMGEPYRAKRVAALRIGLALAWLGLANDHQVSLFTCTDTVQRLLPPQKGLGHLHGMIQALRGTRCAGIGDPARVLRTFRPQGGGSGMLVFISDLLGNEPEAAVEALRRLGALPGEVHVVQVLDRDEVAPETTGSFRLEDVENGTVRQLDMGVDELRRYQDLVRGWCAALGTAAQAARIAYLPWRTDADLHEQLRSLLDGGRALVEQR